MKLLDIEEAAVWSKAWLAFGVAGNVEVSPDAAS
jgi:hypothetical protein